MPVVDIAPRGLANTDNTVQEPADLPAQSNEIIAPPEVGSNSSVQDECNLQSLADSTVSPQAVSLVSAQTETRPEASPEIRPNDLQENEQSASPDMERNVSLNVASPVSPEQPNELKGQPEMECSLELRPGCQVEVDSEHKGSPGAESQMPMEIEHEKSHEAETQVSDDTSRNVSLDAGSDMPSNTGLTDPGAVLPESESSTSKEARLHDTEPNNLLQSGSQLAKEGEPNKSHEAGAKESNQTGRDVSLEAGSTVLKEATPATPHLSSLLSNGILNASSPVWSEAINQKTTGDDFFIADDGIMSSVSPKTPINMQPKKTRKSTGPRVYTSSKYTIYI